MHSTLQPVHTVASIRAIEAQAFAQQPPAPLMERAGLAAAECARRLAGERGEPVLILAGPGNNGGDAFVAARHLKSWFFDVTVVFAGDAATLPADAKAAFAAWREAGGACVTAIPADRRWALAVDGLFGIGLARPLKGPYAALIARFNALTCPRLALDIPSGLEADTGRVLGCAARATHTLTFIGLKAGLLTLDGPDHCGAVDVAALDLDPSQPQAPGARLDAALLNGLLPTRARNSHKGDFGSVAILGGARGMRGAALLAGRAALLTGAGRVHVGVLDDDDPAADPLQPELMLRPAYDLPQLGQLTCIAAGPGLGMGPDAAIALDAAIARDLPLVLDADALNLVAYDKARLAAVAQRGAPTLATPHPAEAARLLGVATRDVQADRIAAAGKLATLLNAHVVLKGAGSVCASPDGRWAINASGNPGMAAAGMGDVLTGITVALLAQGAAPDLALAGAVCLHGAAADALVARSVGPVGLTASEVALEARAVLNRSL
ncbi:MAG: NAD(P)H-hydrate dehydratase [Burkholderiales bacterium]